MKDKVRSILKSFLIKAIIIFVVWQVAYYGFILPNGRANSWLTIQVVTGTKVGLDLLGYDSDFGQTDIKNPQSSRYIYIDNQPVVLVADECNGFELMALYIGFLLAFPGPWKWKAIFILVGTVVIFIVNILREVVLALNYKYFQESFDFNHKYTYVFVVYSVIFLIWRFWLNNYSLISQKNEN